MEAAFRPALLSVPKSYSYEQINPSQQHAFEGGKWLNLCRQNR